jgi:putative ABC transport system substrate-binding protein
MRIRTPLFILFFLLLPVHALAEHADLVVVQSSVLQPYEEVRQGFLQAWSRSTPRHGIKSVPQGSVKEFILSEEQDRRSLPERIKNLSPDMIIAIGTNALNLTARIPDIPIIYLLVPYPETIVSRRKNLIGIRMTIPAGRQLKDFIKTFPWLKRIGVIYDPKRSLRLIKDAKSYTDTNNLVLVSRAVSDSHEVPGQLADLQGDIDCFWMIPDLTVTTPQTVEAILLFSLENRVPVLTFSEKYLRMGATVSVTYDLNKMGKQASELANRILFNGAVSQSPYHEVESTKISINRKVAEKLGIPSPAEGQSDTKE